MDQDKWSSSELTVKEDQVVAKALEQEAVRALDDEHDKLEAAAVKKLRAEHAKLKEEAAAGREMQRKADVVDSIRSFKEVEDCGDATEDARPADWSNGPLDKGGARNLLARTGDVRQGVEKSCCYGKDKVIGPNTNTRTETLSEAGEGIDQVT
jgi:hypothetical protein